MATLVDHTDRGSEAEDAALVAAVMTEGTIIEASRNFHDAKGLTQTTFFEVLNTIDRLKDHAKLGSWLRAITINRCINFRKLSARLGTTPSDMVCSHGINYAVSDIESVSG